MAKSLKPTSTRNLLATLTDSPHLPAYVAQMPSRSLGYLIDHVGLEDAGALVELANDRQLAEILDERLWLNVKPGEQELFSLHQFLEWCELWLDIGERWAADRVRAQGETMLTLGVSRLSTVIDTTEQSLGFSTDASEARISSEELGASYGEFLVTGAGEMEWDVLRRVLDAVWAEYPDFLIGVLRQCCFRHSLLAMNDHRFVAHSDASAARELARQEKGFVTPLTATVFLGATKDAELAALVHGSMDDLGVAALMARMRLRPAADQAEQDSEHVEGDKEPEIDTATDVRRREEFARLDQTLRDAELLDGEQLLLESPEEGARSPSARRRLVELGRHDASEFGRAMTEVVFLANTLISGTTFRGRRLSDSEGADAALACIGIGLDHLEREGMLALDVLARETGVVRAFRIGWHLLARLPLQTITLLQTALYMEGPGSALRVQHWVRDRVAEVLRNHDLLGEVEGGDFEAAKSAISLLSIVFDNQTCTNLDALVDPFPSLPSAIEHPEVIRIHVDSATRFIDSLDDLALIADFLEHLPERV